ncbi:MAG: TolC family protein [Cyanobacteria bacterium HKST-UBA01]|nr:TolC family protein [Cyanobacteria bacterium HKST-UBA01]
MRSWSKLPTARTLFVSISFVAILGMVPAYCADSNPNQGDAAPDLKVEQGRIQPVTTESKEQKEQALQKESLEAELDEPLKGLSEPLKEKTDSRTGLSEDQSTVKEGLESGSRKEDYDVINIQAKEFRNRFLKGEAIEVRLPMPDQLIPLGGKLPPIRLDASFTRPVSLKAVVDHAIDHNLDIRISEADRDSSKYLYYGSLGKFLPDINMSYRWEHLQGGRLIGGIIPTSFDTPNVTTSAGFNYWGFRGGSIFYGALENLHRYKASKELVHGTINDVLLNITQNYYTMVRNEALLEIQTRAVEVSQAQVDLNRQLESAGTGTKFQVLQSETQLARDQQNLLTQQVDLRKSAIDLATALNLNAAVNLLSVENEVRKVRLIDPNTNINRLIDLAVRNRPELKQFEQLRIAAKRNIQVQAAPLYPKFSFFGNVTGSGATLTRALAWSDPSYQTVATGTVIPGPAIDETGLPRFAADNATLGFGGGGTSNSTIYQAGQVLVPSQRVSRQIRKSFTIGFQFDWNFTALGVPDFANVASAKAIARKAMLQSNQQLMNVLKEVRSSYLTSQTVERQIEVATKEVISSAEQLRLARVRLANGVGTNIDVINAQRDFTNALVNKADAIIAFNIAQAQLLRDIGVISRDSLTSGRLIR